MGVSSLSEVGIRPWQCLPPTAWEPGTLPTLSTPSRASLGPPRLALHQQLTDAHENNPEPAGAGASFSVHPARPAPCWGKARAGSHPCPELFKGFAQSEAQSVP